MLGGLDMPSSRLAVIMSFLVSACAPDVPTPTGPMQLVVYSDAGEFSRELSDIERGRVADWILDESAAWTEADFPDADTAAKISGDRFQIFLKEEMLVLCGHAVGCRGRPTPVAQLIEVTQQ